MPCGKCGSGKVIPDVPLWDSMKQVGLAVPGKPDAWLFKETAAGHLHAAICGECGHVEFRVDSFRELYEAFLKSRGE